MKYRIKIYCNYDGKIWFQPQKHIFLWFYSFCGTLINHYEESYATYSDALEKINEWNEDFKKSKFKIVSKYKYIKL